MGQKRTPRGITTGCSIFLADGEGFEPPEGLPLQRFSRPPHSTALPTILNFLFLRRSFNLRLCSLTAPDGAAHHSLAFGYTAFALLTRMQDRRNAPSANHPKLFFSVNGAYCTLFFAHCKHKNCQSCKKHHARQQLAHCQPP